MIHDVQRLKKYLVGSFAFAVAAIAVGEASSRYYLGLGTPPLSITHPSIEYLYKPDQDVYRFGNHYIVNQYGMRTVPIHAVKDSRDYRIMVFGDSVLNGGALTDHSSLATTLLADKLSAETSKNVIVGNISAGSWGPGNWLAYAREYGFFDADVIVLVISSHDYADNPTFLPLNEGTHPTQAPKSALLEGITRYLPRYLPKLTSSVKSAIGTDHFQPKVDEARARQGLNDLKQFLELAQRTSAEVLVFQHWEKSELESGSAATGNQSIQEVCRQVGVPTLSLEPFFRQSLNSGIDPYRDNIHPNLVGQQLLGEAIYQNLPNWDR